jgi:hypothetical protein
VLTFAQPRDEHDFAVGKLKRIAVAPGLVRVDLPEPRYLPVDPPVVQKTEPVIAVHLSVEPNLSARQQAHRNVRLAHRRKSARAGITEPGRDQLVSDLSGSIRNIVQTVVTHRRYSCCEQPGWLFLSGASQQITVALLSPGPMVSCFTARLGINPRMIRANASRISGMLMHPRRNQAPRRGALGHDVCSVNKV